jgi:hypothetical protein
MRRNKDTASIQLAEDWKEEGNLNEGKSIGRLFRIFLLI